MELSQQEDESVGVRRRSLTTNHDGAIDFAARGTLGPEPGTYRLRIKRRLVEGELREPKRGDRGRMGVRLEEAVAKR